jgi:hypothetical protein
VWEDGVPSFGASNGATQKKNKNKVHGGLNRPPIGKPTHNNQPKIRGKDGGVIEEAVRPGGSMQGLIPLLWGHWTLIVYKKNKRKK